MSSKLFDLFYVCTKYKNDKHSNWYCQKFINSADAQKQVHYRSNNGFETRTFPLNYIFHHRPVIQRFITSIYLRYKLQTTFVEIDD